MHGWRAGTRAAEFQACSIWYIVYILCKRRQRVKLGQHLSEWSQVRAGVPHGTLVGPISFLLHINDLQTVVNHVKYVDDSSLWEVCGADGGNSLIQVATDQAVEWSARNLMTINAEKTKEMMISFSNKPVAPPPVTINNTAIERTETFELLGVVLSNKLDWSDHCEYLHTKGSQRLYLVVLLRRAGVPDHDILRIYTSMIRSVLEYAAPVWHTSLSQEQSERLESVQKRALRVVYPDLSYRRALSLWLACRPCIRDGRTPPGNSSCSCYSQATNCTTCCHSPGTLGTILDPCPNIPG